MAARIDKHETRARTLMARGDIIAATQPWGDRQVWMAYESDVQHYLDGVAGTTLTDLAAELHMDYHQLWTLAGELQLLDPGRPRGAKIRMPDDAVKLLRAELDRRASAAAEVMTVKEAARQLQMETTLVETLIRRGDLDVIQGPTGVRRRYVSCASVEAYDLAYPVTPPSAAVTSEAEPEQLLTCTEARRLLRVSRNDLTSLVATRQLSTGSKPGSPHVYVTAASAIGWAERTRRAAVASAIRRHLDRRVR